MTSIFLLRCRPSQEPPNRKLGTEDFCFLFLAAVVFLPPVDLSERWFDGSNPSTAESMMGNKNSNTTKTNTKNRNHNDINHNNIDHNSIDDSFVQLQELKDLGLQRRTKMIEKSRWKNKKNNNKNNNKIHQKDWRQDKSISTDDTPSLSHDLSRLTIDKKWTIQYNREKSSFVTKKQRRKYCCLWD